MRRVDVQGGAATASSFVGSSMPARPRSPQVIASHYVLSGGGALEDGRGVVDPGCYRRREVVLIVDAHDRQTPGLPPRGEGPSRAELRTSRSSRLAPGVGLTSPRLAEAEPTHVAQPFIYAPIEDSGQHFPGHPALRPTRATLITCQCGDRTPLDTPAGWAQREQSVPLDPCTERFST